MEELQQELETTTKEEKDLAEEAAKTFSQLLPVWNRFVANAPRKSLGRVVKAVFTFPLNEYPLKFQNKGEVEAFKIGSILMDSKSIMVSAVMEEKLKKEKGEQNETTETMASSGQSLAEPGNEKV